MTTRELNELNELNKDALGILQTLAAIERDSNARADQLVARCDLDSQTVLFLANESVARRYSQMHEATQRLPLDCALSPLTR